MRLLQLATAPDRLIDLHPNVTVVAGLDEEERRMLADTIVGLARGVAPGRAGLLEAHGLLFDLTDEMLALLDVSAEGLRPLVTPADLPTIRRDPNARERIGAERALGEIEERWATAGEHQRRLRLTRDSAADALEHARRNATEAEAGAAERIRLLDELSATLDHIDERRRQLLDQQATRTPQAEQAAARQREVEAATSDVRTRHQEAAIACSALAARLDEARLGLDAGSVDAARAAADELARVEAEVDAERAADAALGETNTHDGEPPAERLARIQAQIEDIEKRLAAFGPTEVHGVSSALDRLRALDDGELVPSPEAEALADQLAQLDADLEATAGVGTGGGLAATKTRLDDARQALLEAEQAVRNPELDRGLVDRLELAHADLLDALDKADGRFAGARAQRRVDTSREAEQAILDELGFASYSDYMMGYSLLNIDPEKEATLEAARTELSAAEDEWRILQADTEAELARAERMERRRLLVADAATLLERPVPARTAVDELRAHRVPATLPPEVVDQLEHSLEAAGLALEGEGLSRDELMLLAEAWLDEAADAAVREQDLRRELDVLAEERPAALAAVEAEAARAASAADRPAPEDDRRARLEAARAVVAETEARQRVHLEADALVTSITAELAAAAETERIAADASADADAAVAEAAARAEQLAAEVTSIGEELAALTTAEQEANEHLQSLTEHEDASPEELAEEVRAAEEAFAAADGRLQEASHAMQVLTEERTEAQAAVASFQDAVEPVDEGSIAEEIEWYLLARLAAQRAVCLGGSLPLLLDDALEGLDEQQLGHVLGRLERMADAVQVIVVSDDPLAASWALMAGQDRAAVVRPQPA